MKRQRMMYSIGLALFCVCIMQPAVAAQPTPSVPSTQTTPSTPTTLTAPPLPTALPGQGEVFRSVDENGTPTFSQTPPSGRASRPVELKPLAGSIDAAKASPAVPAARAAAEPERTVAPAAEPERARPSPGPRGMAFEVYIRIQRGMSEGELLTRAGPPDYRGNENNRGLVQESWYYLPTSNDPFTTIIQMRGGRVIDTERIRKL